MADFEEANFIFPAQKLNLLDENIQKILSKCENEPREDVLEELTTDFDVEMLLEEREKCFSLAKQELQRVLKNEGTLAEEEMLDIKCVRRTGKSAKKNIGKELMDLFDFVVGYKKIFPRHLITKDSKLVDNFANGEGNETEKQSLKITDKMRLVELQNIVMEMKEKLDSVIEENRAVKSQLKELENVIDGLKCQTVLDKPIDGSTKNAVQSSSRTVVERGKTDEKQEESSLNKQQAMQKTEEDFDNHGKGSTSDDSEVPCAQRTPKRRVDKRRGNWTTKHHEKQKPEQGAAKHNEGISGEDDDIPCAQRTPKCPEQSMHYNVMSANGIDWTTVIQKKRGKKRISSSSSDDVQVTEVSRQADQAETQRPHTSQMQAPQPKLKETYGQIVKNRRKLLTEASQNHMKSNMNNKTSLKGIKQERGVALYLKSIHVNEETNEEIGRMVKDYAGSKGFRIMGFQVIRYRTCDDAVGCKIFVPDAQQHQALNPDAWPRDITCRRWERPDVWQERVRHQQKRQHEDRLRSRVDEMRNGRDLYEGDIDRFEYYGRDY